MIIDDDPDIVDSMTMILEANGHEAAVKTDTDGMAAGVMEVHADLITPRHRIGRSTTNDDKTA